MYQKEHFLHIFLSDLVGLHENHPSLEQLTSTLIRVLNLCSVFIVFCVIDNEIEHPWGELDGDADYGGEATHRLALVNMDWDRVKAKDIMVLLNSFKSPNGVILSVQVN